MSSSSPNSPDQDISLSQQLRKEHDGIRILRPASPAIKRPASDMGAQEREEHTQDRKMDDAPQSSHEPPDNHTDGFDPLETTPKAKQQDTGSRHDAPMPSETTKNRSNPKAHSQTTPSEDSSSSVTNMSTAPTSVNPESSPTTSVPRPQIDEQIKTVTSMLSKPVQDKQKGYVVSQKWLNKVLAKSSEGPIQEKIDKEAMEAPIGPVDNSDLALVTEGSGKFEDEAGEIFVPVRPGLVFGEDYQVLPEEAWDLVTSWYGIDENSPIVTRYAHNTALNPGSENIIYEMSPPIFSILKLPSEQSTTTQSIQERDLPPAQFLASSSTGLNAWLKKAKTVARIDMQSKVRLWRILGGLKSSSQSGMLTPAASRSASPAPGALIVASAGDKLVLDLNTFTALSIGVDREILDIKDQTANEKYNGSATLHIAGLASDTVIVLEEQVRGPAGGEWPSDSIKPTTRLTVSKSIASDKRGKVSSGRSSPGPGMMTRGRQKQAGKPKGITGLGNMGNTCYMNSALQCLRSVEELTQYFLHDKYKADLNPSNPLSHHGDVAKAYAMLLHQLYADNSPGAYTPRQFKATIGRYGPNFSGYGQQDSQEFLLFLLDGLQEDLNRVQDKPYIEKPDSTDEMVKNPELLREMADKCWDIYLARNSSVVSDLFAGMYKSTVVCPVCDKVSIIFDPFNNLTLQLPIENTWTKEIFYFPLHRRPIRVDVDIDKNATFKQLKEFVAKRMKSDPDKLILAEIYKNRYYKMFDNRTVISEAGIQNNDEIGLFEVEAVPSNYDPNKQKKLSLTIWTSSQDEDIPDYDSPGGDKMLISVFHRVKKMTAYRAQKQFFGVPAYIIVTRDEAKDEQLILKKLLAKVATMTTINILLDDQSDSATQTPEDSDTLVMNDDDVSSDSNRVHATSVQSEDDFVDVSMRDVPETPGNKEDEVGTLPSVLQPGTFIPGKLQNLFSVHYASTNEAVPTGANNLDDSKEFPSILSRKRNNPQRSRQGERRRRFHNFNSSASSDEEIDRPPRGARSSEFVNESDAESEGNKSDLESGSLPSSDDLLRSSRPTSPRGTRGLKTYSRKDSQLSLVRSREKPQNDAQPLIRPGEALILDWGIEAHEAFFEGVQEQQTDDFRGAPTWSNIDIYKDEELAAKKQSRQTRRRNGISLDDCLDEFGKAEILSENDAWYCPRCKEHRRASKKFELWKVPDILVMHFKRFSSSRNFRDKLEVFVDYPVEGLDLSNRVIINEDKSLVYDLIAVDNHYGGLGGGHYTASAQNFFDKGWYDYNGKSVASFLQGRLLT